MLELYVRYGLDDYAFGFIDDGERSNFRSLTQLRRRIDGIVGQPGRAQLQCITMGLR